MLTDDERMELVLLRKFKADMEKSLLNQDLEKAVDTYDIDKLNDDSEDYAEGWEQDETTGKWKQVKVRAGDKPWKR